MSTSKKQVKSSRGRRPVTLDMIDQANVDIDPAKRMSITKEELRVMALFKKEVIITVRITEEIKETIQSLANRDERTPGWMARKLLLEALEARSLLETGERHSRLKVVRKDMIKEETAAYGWADDGAAGETLQEALMFLKIPALRPGEPPAPSEGAH